MTAATSINWSSISGNKSDPVSVLFSGGSSWAFVGFRAPARSSQASSTLVEFAVREGWRMSPVVNSLLGLLFFADGLAATLLAYHLWGYPYDKEALRSSAPLKLVLIHRLLGYVYVCLYAYFLTQMVPRLWNYQIEFPARTVVHLTLGMAIGVILLIKVMIVRWFRHLEARLLPALGTSLLIATALLLGLSVPFALRERYLQAATFTGGGLDPERRKQVHQLLRDAAFQDDGEIERLLSPSGLRLGQEVLTHKCVGCHDLRTVLAKPQTPDNWRGIVRRMSVRSALFDPISEREQSHVTAYLVAISPQLQQSARSERTAEKQTDASLVSLNAAIALVDQMPSKFDKEHARHLFESKCSQCHDLKQVEESPPHSINDVNQLVSRMVRQGLTGTSDELAAILRHLRAQYVR
jgi:cytochrome c5